MKGGKRNLGTALQWRCGPFRCRHQQTGLLDHEDDTAIGSLQWIDALDPDAMGLRKPDTPRTPRRVGPCRESVQNGSAFDSRQIVVRPKRRADDERMAEALNSVWPSIRR